MFQEIKSFKNISEKGAVPIRWARQDYLSIEVYPPNEVRK